MNDLQPQDKARNLIQKHRLFTGIGEDAEGNPVNNYLVSKHVAKKSALITAHELSKIQKEYYEYWCEVISEIINYKF